VPVRAELAAIDGGNCKSKVSKADDMRNTIARLMAGSPGAGKRSCECNGYHDEFKKSWWPKLLADPVIASGAAPDRAIYSRRVELRDGIYRPFNRVANSSSDDNSSHIVNVSQGVRGKCFECGPYGSVIAIK
jgi:hypothetical protein